MSRERPKKGSNVSFLFNNRRKSGVIEDVLEFNNRGTIYSLIVIKDKQGKEHRLDSWNSIEVVTNCVDYILQ